MLGIVFTLDYEIHGNGEGSPSDLMVEPTERLLRLFDDYGAKLTILADVAEILKFKEYFEDKGVDDFYYGEIVEQLRRVIRNGHDVQLHIHSSYFNAVHKDGRWIQDWSEYNMAALPYDRIFFMINKCKSFLEDILRPVKDDYRCFVFRAANWSMSPSENIIKALNANEITIDTSVFKYGVRSGRVSFDYSEAFSEVLPWPTSIENICSKNPEGDLFEFPIYSEQKNILSFITVNRLYRFILSALHKHEKILSPPGSVKQKNNTLSSKIISLVNNKYPLKLDFNQCSYTQLINSLVHIDKKYCKKHNMIPVVMIGHSKLFTSYNRIILNKFLNKVVEKKEAYKFSTFSDFDLNDYINV